MAITPLHVLFRVTVDGGALSHYDVQSLTVLCHSCILCIGGRSDEGEIITGIILHVVLLQCHQVVTYDKAHCRASSFVFCSVYCMKSYHHCCVSGHHCGGLGNRWRHH